MTKADVIKIMGTPSSVSAKDNAEYLRYQTQKSILVMGRLTTKIDEYFVRLVNGKVESYGTVGDFDSTKDQTNIIRLETQK